MSGLGYALRYFAADLTPMIVFLLVFLASKNIYLATGVGIGLSVLQIGWSFARKSPIGMLQWAGFGLIAVFGAATLVAGGLFLIQNVFLRNAKMLEQLPRRMLRPLWRLALQFARKIRNCPIKIRVCIPTLEQLDQMLSQSLVVLHGELFLPGP